MHIASFATVALLTLSACAPESDDESGEGEGEAAPCDADVNCSVVDGEETCDPGYLFESPGTEDFTCRDTGWLINDRIDPIDDSRDVNLIIPAAEVYVNAFGQEIHPGLAILCSDTPSNGSLAVFQTGSLESAGAPGLALVTVRVDDDDAIEYEAGEDNGILFFQPDDGEALSARIYSSSSVVLRFTPFNQFEETAQFDTSDFAEVVEPYANVCGYAG